MKRRDFVKKSVAAATVAAATTAGVSAHTGSTTAKKFNMKYAPHIGMFKNSAGEDPVDQLNFMADEGFTAFEDNGMKGRDKSLQEKMASTMAKRGLEMGVFVAHKIYWTEASLTSGKAEFRDEFLKDIRDSVEVAKRVNAKWMTVVPGHLDLRKDMGYQTVNVIETLKKASDILEPHGLVMVLEPLNFYNHPGLFLTKISQGFEICRAVGSPSCKILFDMYHQQITEGNIIPNIEAAWDEVGYFQIGDNPGRNEPTTGEMNYLNLFKHIHNKGFTGILGMEHGNAEKGKEGERRLIDAYRQVDGFM
ncbi:MAG: TIM barrel protein [Bacteroidia bacterium]